MVLLRDISGRWRAALRPPAVRPYCRMETGRLNLPNIITLARLLMVPVVVWAIGAGEMSLAFLLFVAAGISDAVDGFLAKRFNMVSELGSFLDPLADKALIVSIYVSLGFSGAIPRWLVILVVSRDIMIVAAVMLSWFMGRPIAMKPLLVSKLNTVAQIVFAGLVLGALAFRLDLDILLMATAVLVACLTLLSITLYLFEWLRHMNSATTS